MKVVLIGSGNVATHLGPELQRAGHDIAQVYSRKYSNAEVLAEKLGSSAIDDLKVVDTGAEIYLIMVSDDAIQEIADKMPRVSGLVAHTAGAVSAEPLRSISEDHGVLWTPQTFSKGRVPELKNAPFCVEASNARSLELLRNLAGCISSDVREVTGKQRKAAHLAAVIGSNFSNFMYTLAAQVLAKEDMDLSVIAPLLKETLNKALDIGPEIGQTGPARRGDRKVIEEHLKQLADDPELEQIYEELSSAIIRHYAG